MGAGLLGKILNAHFRLVVTEANAKTVNPR